MLIFSETSKLGYFDKYIMSKVRMYESLVMSTMLYSAEIWPLSVMQKKTRSSTL